MTDPIHPKCKHGTDARFCSLCNAQPVRRKRVSKPARELKSRRHQDSVSRAAPTPERERHRGDSFQAGTFKGVTGVPKGLVWKVLEEVEVVERHDDGRIRRVQYRLSDDEELERIRLMNAAELATAMAECGRAIQHAELVEPLDRRLRLLTRVWDERKK